MRLELISTGLVVVAGLFFAFRSWWRCRYDIVYPILALMLVVMPYLIFPLYLYAEHRYFTSRSNKNFYRKYSCYKVFLGCGLVLFGLAFYLLTLWLFMSASNEMGNVVHTVYAHICTNIAILLILPVIMTVIYWIDQKLWRRRIVYGQPQ